MYNLKNITNKNKILNDNLFLKNSAIFSDYYNINLNFKKLLRNQNHIIFKNCHDLSIEIQNDINRIEIYQCSNIKIKIKKLIGGLLLKKSKINVIFATKIYNIELEESEIIIPKKVYNNINYISKTKSKILPY